jgi:hypothetical protein
MVSLRLSFSEVMKPAAMAFAVFLVLSPPHKPLGSMARR